MRPFRIAVVDVESISLVFSQHKYAQIAISRGFSGTFAPNGAPVLGFVF
jgi:hypothetical protein